VYVWLLVTVVLAVIDAKDLILEGQTKGHKGDRGKDKTKRGDMGTRALMLRTRYQKGK
jgi:hypothetical protein